MVPDVALYYEALHKGLLILNSRKPRNDAEAQAPLLLLQEVVRATKSPVQLLPLAKVLDDTKLNLSQSELASLLNTLAAAIDNFPLDDNAFHSGGQNPVVKARDQLVSLAVAKQVSPYALVHAVHNYLDRSLNGPHCARNVPKDLKELDILYESWNRSTKTSDPVEPLSPPASAPPIEPAPDVGDYWLSPKGEQPVTLFSDIPLSLGFALIFAKRTGRRLYRRAGAVELRTTRSVSKV